METRLCWCRCVSRERANSAVRCQQCTACSQTVRRAKVTVLSRWSAPDDATGGAQIGRYVCRPCVWHDPTRGGVDVCACPHPPAPARISKGAMAGKNLVTVARWPTARRRRPMELLLTPRWHRSRCGSRSGQHPRTCTARTSSATAALGSRSWRCQPRHGGADGGTM